MGFGPDHIDGAAHQFHVLLVLLFNFSPVFESWGLTTGKGGVRQ